MLWASGKLPVTYLMPSIAHVRQNWYEHRRHTFDIRINDGKSVANNTRQQLNNKRVETTSDIIQTAHGQNAIQHKLKSYISLLRTLSSNLCSVQLRLYALALQTHAAHLNECVRKLASIRSRAIRCVAGRSFSPSKRFAPHSFFVSNVSVASLSLNPHRNCERRVSSVHHSSRLHH